MIEIWHVHGKITSLLSPPFYVLCKFGGNVDKTFNSLQAHPEDLTILLFFSNNFFLELAVLNVFSLPTGCYRAKKGLYFTHWNISSYK